MSGVEVIEGDCLKVMRRMAEASVDSIVTDPPYALTANKKGGSGIASLNLASPAGRSRVTTGGGFMGKEWDAALPGVEVWSEALRVAKPGAHLLAFGGTRTFHRLACAVEDAGWEIRDCIMWVYSQGFPKSHNLGGGWVGWGTALKPAWEPIIVARKPLDGTVVQNMQEHGTGAINVDGCRVAPTGESRARAGEDSQERRYADKGGTNFAATPGVRGGDPAGRWPANLVHDGSEEVLFLFPAQKSGANPERRRSDKFRNSYHKFKGERECVRVRGAEVGSAARFFYCAKASQEERTCGGQVDNRHPTVKPVALMRWLVRLVTRKGGLVLDPFCGSGSTGIAARAEGMQFLGIEQDLENAATARARLAASAPAQRDLL